MSDERGDACPFYGRALIQGSLRNPILTPTQARPGQGNNQCALITRAHAPCCMEQDALAPNWDKCGRNPVINGTEARRRMELIRRAQEKTAE